MATELKELLNILADVIGKMPDTALWILAGFFIFKMSMMLAPMAGLYQILRVLIEKVHDAKTKPKEVIETAKFEDIVLGAAAQSKLHQTLKDVIYHVDGIAGGNFYNTEADHLLKAWNEYKEKHKDEYPFRRSVSTKV